MSAFFYILSFGMTALSCFVFLSGSVIPSVGGLGQVLAAFGFVIAAIFAVGAAILDVLNAIREATVFTNRNTWNVGLAQWQELRFPGAEHPVPVANEDGYREASIPSAKRDEVSQA